MSRFLDPRNDVAFKRIFLDETERLRSFLNSVLLEYIKCEIVSVEFLSSEEVPNIRYGKRNVFDLKIRDADGKVYVIEMQKRTDSSFLSRVQLYGSHALVAMAKKGEQFRNLMPVIVVVICDQNLFDDKLECINFHEVTERKTGKSYLPLLQYLFIELPKFKKSESELSSITDDWIYMFKYAEKLMNIPKHTQDKNIVGAYEEMERFNWSAAQYDAYFCAELSSNEEYSKMKDARIEGKAEGKAEGRAEGEAKGKIEGLAEGELNAKREIAKKMLSKNQDIELISDITGLSIEKIKEINITL